MFEAPELRHLRSRTKGFRIFQPLRNPFLAQLQTNVFQVRSDFLLILKQVTRLEIEFVDARGELAIDDAERLRAGEQSSNFRLVTGVRAGVGFPSCFALIRANLLLELENLLASVR